MRLQVYFTTAMAASLAFADPVQEVVDRSMAGLDVRASDSPYSRTIERIYLGLDEHGTPRTGIAHREIESFKPITGVVVVDRTEGGFVLREALFPDIDKIKNANDRRDVLGVLASFRNIPFDPHAEKSAVDTVSGATRYAFKTTGYLNYMARHVALQMENPPEWALRKN